MFKRTKATKLNKRVRVTAELKDGLIVSRTYFTNSLREAYSNLDKEFRYEK